MTDFNSYTSFYKNCFFGGYPKKEHAEFLIQKHNIDVFVDLTEIHEISEPYEVNAEYINYPIRDVHVPTNIKTFSIFIIKLLNLISNSKSLYIHCKGGHGRSGVVVAILITKLYQIGALNALAMTTKFHSNRTDLKLRWRLLGSPQTQAQRNFVVKFFSPLCFSRVATNGNKSFFHPQTKNIFTYNELEFNSIEECYAKFATKEDDLVLMKNIYKHILLSNEMFQINLFSTGCRQIFFITTSKIWGIDSYGQGNNYIGKILEELRSEFIVSII